MSKVIVHHGDSRDVLKGIADASIDSVVCDPPYALVSIVKRFGKEGAAPAVGNEAYMRASAGFMGKQWDTGETAFDPAFWREVLRVMKPGAHLIAFSGTRTYHRLACAIEDAGFDGVGPSPEIRDMISNFIASDTLASRFFSSLSEEQMRAYLLMQEEGDFAGMLSWTYGAGFPKSHNLDKQRGKLICGCDDDSEEIPERHVRPVRVGHVSPTINTSDQQRQVLQSSVSQQGSSGAVLGTEPTQGGSGSEEQLLEGRRDVSKTARELRECPLHPLPGIPDLDGAERRLRNGASARDGGVGGASTDPRGDRSPHRPQAAKQSPCEPGTLAGQPESQAGGAWPVCGGCGKPRVTRGLGTALKPACEPMVFARKPLDGTVANNVLKHGTGAINIDGSRIEAPEGSVVRMEYSETGSQRGYEGGLKGGRRIKPQTVGRFPANVIHDGSTEVIAAFGVAPGQQRGVGPANGPKGSVSVYGDYGPREQFDPRGDTGSAARFFYSSKADGDDRVTRCSACGARWIGKRTCSCPHPTEQGKLSPAQGHPTVKPVDLMAYLCRLVTPPGGVVLDCFAGSGTTGMACLREGFDAILIEREAEYVGDIKHRLKHVQGEDAPLFAFDGGEAA